MDLYVLNIQDFLNSHHQMNQRSVVAQTRNYSLISNSTNASKIHLNVHSQPWLILHQYALTTNTSMVQSVLDVTPCAQLVANHTSLNLKMKMTQNALLRAHALI
jgi:hypothetical protein